MASDGSYQRVKLYVAAARRAVIAAEKDAEDDSPAARARGLHRRFEVLPGAQAQVDWGAEGVLIGMPKVYSFHMTLSYS
jgi:hypothetical protein